MELKTHRVLGWQTSYLHAFVVILGLVATAAVTSAQESKPVDEDSKPADTRVAQAMSDPAEPSEVSKMPDISGVWIVVGKNGKNGEQGVVVIGPPAKAPAGFEFCTPHFGDGRVHRATWSQEAQRFQATIDEVDEGPATLIMQFQADSGTVRVTLEVSEQAKEVLRKSGVSEQALQERLKNSRNQEWRRLDVTGGAVVLGAEPTPATPTKTNPAGGSEKADISGKWRGEDRWGEIMLDPVRPALGVQMLSGSFASSSGRTGTIVLTSSEPTLGRFQGEWFDGENLQGQMSLRLLSDGNWIRGSWNTDPGSKFKEGMPEFGDLEWVRVNSEPQPTAAKPVADLRMPDISGKWQVGKRGIHVKEIRRLEDGEFALVSDNRFGSSHDLRLKWVANNSYFDASTMSTDQKRLFITKLVPYQNGEILDVIYTFDEGSMTELRIITPDLKWIAREEWMRPGSAVVAANVEPLERENDFPELPKDSEIRVFALTNASADECSRLLKELFLNAKISSDLRTNSVIVVGPKAQLGVIEAVVLRFDQTAPRPANSNEPQVSFIRLTNSSASEAARFLTALGVAGKFRVESFTNSLIVQYTDNNQLQKVSEFLTRLEEVAPAKIDTKPEADSFDPVTRVPSSQPTEADAPRSELRSNHPDFLARRSERADSKWVKASSEREPTLPTKPVTDSKMPDITGTWSVNFVSPAVKAAPIPEMEIRRVQTGATDFLIDQPWIETVKRISVKWSAARQRFEGEWVDDGELSKITLQPLNDSNTMRVIIANNKKQTAKETSKDGGTSASNWGDLTTQEWTRTSLTFSTTFPAKHFGLSETAVSSGNDNGPEKGSVRSGVGVNRTDLVPQSHAIPDTPTAKQLVEQLGAQESAAAAEAATIRQLQANGQAEQNQQPIAEHQRKLKNLLSTAFDLKLQLEELQVKELQSRLSRFEGQIGQREGLREKIIARRAGQLIEGDVLKWSADARGIGREKGGGVGE